LLADAEQDVVVNADWLKVLQPPHPAGGAPTGPAELAAASRSGHLFRADCQAARIKIFRFTEIRI
jgi:hypothetical protein